LPSPTICTNTCEKMATRGVYQLTKLNIYYCEIGGSSRALRDYIGNGQLVAWATKYPHVNIEVKRNNGYHPIIHADYVTNSKRILHQVSVKNYESWEHVEEVLMVCFFEVAIRFESVRTSHSQQDFPRSNCLCLGGSSSSDLMPVKTILTAAATATTTATTTPPKNRCFRTAAEGR
jgi:hypothetical protein